MRTTIHFLMAGLIALLGVSPLPTGPPQTPDDPDAFPVWAMPATERLRDAVVMEVIDGDSLVLLVNGQIRRYEILGADAPEWVARAATPRPYSWEAKRFLTNMLLNEQIAVFEPDPGATDPLGRRLAHVFRLPDMAFVDMEIVRQGYGKVSTRAGDTYGPALRWYEARAKELGRGVWGQPTGAEPAPDATPAPAAPSVPASVADPAPARPEQKPPPVPEPQADPGWVWITRSGSKYHREGCSHLRSTRTRVSRDSVKNTHEPCRACAPGGV